jgi:hypothetical protein
MKKCSYCGRENADDAVRCRECGAQEFITSLALPEREPPSSQRPAEILFRLLVSVFVWLVVSGLSLYVAWQTGGDASESKREQSLTQFELKQLDQCLTQYQRQFHASPSSLAQLLAMTNGVPPPEEQPLSCDGWKRPYLFTSDGTNCLITSLGRDGKPGGRGLDCDLTNKDRRPKDAFPTFHQFLFEMPRVRGMIITCLLCGGLAFLLCLSKAKMPKLTLPGLILAAFRLAATVVGAVLVAIIISCLHIPSGH